MFSPPVQLRTARCVAVFELGLPFNHDTLNLVRIFLTVQELDYCVDRQTDKHRDKVTNRHD